MKISLIVPVYNEEPYLQRCIESIKNQTVPFEEVIFVDDDSTDGSLEILQEAEKENQNFHVIAKIVNEGVSAARNDGVGVSHGDYIAFLDSDDELMPDAHEKMLTAIARHPEARMIQFNHLRHYAKINKTVKKYDNRSGWYDIKDTQKMHCWWGIWNKLIRFDENIHDFPTHLRYGEDGIWVLSHLLDGYRIWQEDTETVIHHFENHNSLTKSKSGEQIRSLIDTLKDMMRIELETDSEWHNIQAIYHCIENIMNDPNRKELLENEK